MKTRFLTLAWIFVLSFALAAPARGQGISSSIIGTVVDSASAVVPGTEVELTNESSGAKTKVSSNEEGLFRLTNLRSGKYSVSVAHQGFKRYAQTGIELAASETRDLGKIALEIGNVVETVTVTANATPVQTASSEKSALVTGTQVDTLGLKGRDFLGLMRLNAGVVDTTASRDTTTGIALAGIHIHGGRDNTKLYTIDGVPSVDIGSSNWVFSEPNIETISEVSVLTSNYPAEFGRNSGGVISLITKSGERNFHGSALWNVRNEALNANDFFSNRAGVPRPLYRYNVGTYSISGPVFIPHKFNSDRSRLFFVFSQEYTNNTAWSGVQFSNMPTALERTGNFSQSFDTSSRLIVVKDPVTGNPFPGNMIPASQVNPMGSAILNFFPLPNYAEAVPTLLNQRNYAAQASTPTPRRSDVARVDYNLPQNWTIFGRFSRDNYHTNNHFSGNSFFVTNYVTTYPQDSTAVHVTKIAGPTLVNEVMFGRSHNNLNNNYENQETLLNRSLFGNLPRWFPLDTAGGNELNLIPNVSFGSTPVNPAIAGAGAVPYSNYSTEFFLTYNLTKVFSGHSVKVGIYLEHSGKDQQSAGNYRGALSFAPSSTFPSDSGNGFANALLGNFYSYSETSGRVRVNENFFTAEWYAQDSWRIGRRLTLDIGLRFYHLTPYVDWNHNQTTFDPSMYNPAQAPRLYVPGFNASKQRVAVDPGTGATAPAVLIGRFVPGTGNAANGAVIGGVNGYTETAYKLSPLGLAPRLGFAYDLLGNGKTAVRGGFGIFYNRTDAGANLGGMAAGPPVLYTPSLYYGNLATLGQGGGFIGPTALNFFYYGSNKLETVYNFSFGIQREVGFSTVVDASYVGSLGRHLIETVNINPIPKFAHFNPANADSTNPGSPLPDDLLRPYKGWSDLYRGEFGATSNFHALELNAQRRFRKGLTYGASYTFSKALGISGSVQYPNISAYFPARQWNYGLLSFDRSHNLVLNFTYEIPGPAQRMGARWLGHLTDHWSVSGITTFQTGAPVTPTLTTTNSADLSGSTEAARISVIGDPTLTKSQRTFYQNFNTAAFAPTPVGSFGNAGIGILRQPGINNWDITVGKKIPIGLGEKRMLDLRGLFFNTFNHTQFSGFDSTARFNPAGQQTNGTFGAYNATRLPRQVSIMLRFAF